jgi:PAS domain S-box-containing protein
MNTKMVQFPTINPNPVLSAAKDGTVLYSNEAGNPLLNEWGVEVGEKFPSSILDILQRVILRNSPEKMEIKVGNRIYLVVFSPLPEQECVNISGFDISEQEKLEIEIRDMSILRKLSTQFIEGSDFQSIFQEIVESAIAITNADKGNIQTLDPSTGKLTITAQRGFTPIFLKFFKFVDIGEAAACGTAMKQMKRVVVEDITLSPIFSGSDALHILLNEGVRAVQSTPLISRSGQFLGIISTHFNGVHTPTERELKFIDILARQAADIIERKRAEEALRLSEERFAKAFAHSAAAMSLVRMSDGVYLEVNEAWIDMFGYPRADVIGRTSSQLELWMDEDARETMYRTLREKGSIREEEYTMRRASGEQCFVLVSAEVITMVGEQVILASALDITKRKLAEEALKKAHDNLEEKVKERTVELERAYDSLKESEERLAEAQRIAHVGNWDWNIETNALYWSDEIYRIFGRSPQEFDATYDAFLSYVHPDDREYVNNAVKEALNGMSYGIDHRIILANGEERIVHEQGEVIFDKKNIPVRMMGTVQDITERIKAEEKTKMLADIVESSQDAIGTTTFEGIITSWNKGAEQIYGYSAEEVIGKHVSVLAPPGLKEETYDLSKRVKLGLKVRQYETKRLRKDDTIINISLTLSPVYDESGTPVSISFIARDITESKRTEERLRESEERLRLAQKAAKIGSFEWNIQTGVNIWTPELEAMYGLRPGEFGKTEDAWEQLVHPEDRQNAIRMVEQAIQTSEPTEHEWRVIWSDGSVHWLSGRWLVFKDKTGKPLRLTGVNIDITERKKAEQALANIETARKQEIHHRIKNNLQVISSLLDLQADKFRNKECIKDSEVLEAFRESQDRVISMALIHEELYKGGGFETLNFSPYIKELSENLFQTYSFGNINIKLKLDLAENAFFDIDTAVPLGMIVNELVTNSFKHAFPYKKEGEIQIVLQREENGDCIKSINEDCNSTFMLIVSDNGIGVPEDLDIENLDSLGMQLVTSLVDQLDGELELKRDNGTEFTIRFTVVEKDNQILAPASQLVE